MAEGKKRAVCEPGESGGAAGAAAPLICEEAQRVLQQYSLGVRRVPLDQLGVSPLNRSISGSHVHSLGRRILSVEGFVRWRYRHGWAHEVNPEDPLEVARTTNEVARATPLLAEVPMVPLLGSFAKTHLMSFLQCLRDGNVYWSDTKKLMVCPEAQLVLAEHLKHGMFYEVFTYDCVKKDKGALLKLCKADNFDSNFALGETELQLLRDVHDSLSIARPPLGKTQWDVIKDATATSCGQKWSEEDLNAIYNFAKVVGDVHVAFLTDVVAVHVPWDTIAVRPADFHLAARVGGSLPWLKVALLTAQYFPPEGRIVEGPNQKNYGNLISKTDFERIAKGAGPSLGRAEAFLAYLAGIYLKSGDLPREKLAVEIPAAFARTARAVLLAKDLDADDAVCVEKVETKLREKLAPGELPPPLHHGGE